MTSTPTHAAGAGAPAPRIRRRAALLHGVSATALMVAGSAQAAPFKSLSQALALSNRAAQAAVAPANAVTASKQAALGASNLAAAATRFRSLADAPAHTAAGSAAGANPLVVDGYGPGTGLQAASGATAGGKLWQGATLPTTSVSSAGTTVTVTQSQQLAQLTWQTFNVGRKTTLDFNQSAGGTLASSWVVINKVLDPQANGSLIEGAINAQGKVYVLNRNGIAFTQGSTINVGSLVAATADIAASQFATTASGVTSFNLYGAQSSFTDPVTGLARAYQPTFVNGTTAGITVAPGASIQTAAPIGTNAGGYVMLLGGNVTNAGIISTPQGQTVLAAGTDFTLRQGTQGSTATGNLTATTLGSEVASTNYGTSTAGFLTDVPVGTLFNTGSVTNSGIVVADQGDISLVGHALTQSGILLSTTTVDTRGTIHFLTPTDGTDDSASITLAPGSVTEILPEDLGLIALASQRAANIASSAILNQDRTGIDLTAARLNNTDFLTDQLGESRVELSTGGAVDVGAGALVVAQGGQIALGGGSRVLIETGANLDVSGTTSAILPASINDILVNVQPFQTRDAPGNRNTLKGINLYVDAETLVQIAGGAYDGNIYTPGGVIEVGGYLGLIPHGIAEFTAIGGQVTLQASQLQLGLTNPLDTKLVSGAVITQPGSVINLQGGTVSYQAGAVQQSYLQAADGQVFNVNDAPGDLVYTGVYGGQVVDRPRWQITNYYINPLLTPESIVEPGYTVGRDAGSITIAAATDVIQGAIYAGVTLGQFQNGPRPTTVTDPFLLAETVVPQAGTLSLGNYVSGILQTLTTPTQIVLQATQGPAATIAPPGPSTIGTVAAPVFGTAIIDAGVLSADGLSTIIASTGGSITVSAPVSVADGGTISLTGAAITVDATLTARSGAITLTDQLSNTKLAVAPQTAITLASLGELDARGVWTNNRIDPSHQASLGYANGGSVTIASSNGVTLAAGSRIDVSSGGALLATGKQLTGRGGNITVAADQPFVPSPAGTLSLAPVVLDANFVGVGSGGGGTLSLAAPAFRVGGTGAAGFDTVVLDTSLFSSGFAKYVIDGFGQLNVAPGTQLTVAEPIYVLASDLAVPTGDDPSRAYTVALPPLYLPTKGSDSLTQRAGASVSLLSSVGPGLPLPGQGGPVTIGQGAVIAVDPGQSITVAGYGQVSVFGALIAHGGRVLVANTNYAVDQPTNPLSLTPSTFQSGVSVWLGGQSVIDVSGQAVVQTDPQGRSFGLAGAGGTIALGSLAATAPTFAQVVLRPGAVLDADGAQATVEAVPGLVAGSLPAQPAQPVTLVGSGGTIAVDSITGIALDGTISARAGGHGAAGGLLSLTLDASNLQAFSNIPTEVYQPREFLVTTDAVQVQPSHIRPGETPPFDTYGLVRASQQQIDAGGFGAVALSALGGEIIFDGSVALHAASSITLSTGTIGDSAAAGAVRIAAPVVALVGGTIDTFTNNGTPSAVVSASAATLAIQADLITFSNTLDLGGIQQVSTASTTGSAATGAGTGAPTPFQTVGPPSQGVLTTSFGFAQADFVSTGDIRFLGTTDIHGGSLISTGNLGFEAAQVTTASGATGANNRIIAGYDPAAGQALPVTKGGTITITNTPGAVAQAPYSIGGTLQFIADDILQAGTVRAPEGSLVFSDGSSNGGTVFYPSQVTFAAGSTTSVSLYGQTIPFGGTVDGVTYLAPGGGIPAIFQPVVTVQAQSITAQQGATIDLRGGGTLSGAGFVFGRGGSADVLTTPLLDLTGGAALANANAQVAGLAPLRTNDPIYAILPGYSGSYAPATTTGDVAYTATQPGEQITIGNTVPGLAAGTYTLLPAYYALLPGGYRVELTSGVLPAGTTLPQGNFTSVSPATLSFANTTISSPLPTDALFTSGTDVRQLSQFDEESYNSFEAATATQFGGPRPFLPQDAKTLALLYPGVPTSTIGTSTTGTSTIGTSTTGTSTTGTSTTGTSTTGASATGTASSGDTISLAALTLPAATLLKDPAAGGYGATIEIDTVLPIVVTGPGDIAPAGALALSAATLDALEIPRLVLGGTLTTDINAADTIDINTNNALTPSVDIMPHALLSAGDILLTATASGTVTVEPGGTISTLGAGSAAYDATDGFLFNNVFQSTAFPVLDISNGHVVFIPNTQAATGAAITIGAGSGALAGGSLNVVAPADTVVTIDGAARLGAADASIAVATINIGSTQSLADFAGALPSGLSLTPQALSSLLNGNPALGTPASTVLTLTATQEVNLIGTVALDTGTTDLVLNTPAIYGVAAPSVGAPATQSASITAADFTWSGIAATGNLNLNPNAGIAISALPGGQIAAGLIGQPVGALSIAAGTITLGYGAQAQPNDQIVLDRLVAGFSNVTLTGTKEITANNQSALAVYASQTKYGQPGTGGNLTLASPLITTDNAALLQLTAGGALSLTHPAGTVPTATAPAATLGGEIDITASSATLDTTVALPSGQLNVTAQNAIDVTGAATLDLSGRAVHLFDQTAYAPGGTLAFESTAGSITLATGSKVDVSATGTSAGSVALNALAGGVALDGTLLGAANAGQTGGSFTVVAGTLSTTSQAANVAAGGSAFDTINAGLNAGGFTASRSFEFGTDIGPSGAAATNLTIGNDTAGHALLAASAISVTADLGSIDVTGMIDASGTGPGAITLAAQENLTLEATALLDAHASRTATDSYGQPIDADNRAHVTLTSTAGSLSLLGGTIDLSYPGQATTGTKQGQLVLNAPRVGADDVAITASAPFSVLGAQSIALYGWRTYLAGDADGTVAQGYADHTHSPGAMILSLNAIDADSQAFITAAGSNTALAARLAGLSSYGTSFHLRPGVEIDSTAASAGNITISGDVDLSGYRYSDPAAYGTAVNPVLYGSGEPGAILFRAANDLIVNGSVTDGFAPPPDKKPANYLPADAGWLVLAPSINNNGTAYDAFSADVILPSSLIVTTNKGGVTTTYHHIQLLAGTTFDESRAISLNYAITIASANIAANKVIPFSATIAADENGNGVIIPQGGFVTTALIIEPNGTVIGAGSFLAGGTIIPPGSLFSAGSIFPAAVQVAQNTLVPAGTLLSIFDDAAAGFNTLTLSKRTGALPDNALIPSNTDAQFGLPDATPVYRLELRASTPNADGEPVQGYLYALSALLPAGSQSWNLDFVAGANQASANGDAVLPRSVLDGGALAVPANTANQAPGSLILDDQHYVTASNSNVGNANPAFSVIRTGTGDLSLVAGGDFDQSSLYGIYTAGAQDPLAGGAAANAPYDLAREGANGNNFVTGGGPATPVNTIIRTTYQANYPSGGGDVLVAAQGSVTGDLYGGAATPLGTSLLTSDAIGNWLWRQGSTQLGISTAWWINFGTFVAPYGAGDVGNSGPFAQLTGFQGIGALGGGNVTVIAGQNAGQTTDRSGDVLTGNGAARGEGLVIAVASTGREVSTGGTQSIVQTGGGNVTFRVAGTINPIDAQAYGSSGIGASLNGLGGSTLNGAVIDLRGNIAISAGAVGRLDETYVSNSVPNEPDPRPISPYAPVLTPSDGLTIVPGDGVVSINTQRDLVLDGVADPGRVTEQNLTQVSQAAVGSALDTIGGATGFTLWTADTALSLFAAGGNVAPITAQNPSSPNLAQINLVNDAATDGRFVYPSQLYVTAASGNIDYGDAGLDNAGVQLSLEVAPSANEQLAFLAGGSIQGNGMAIDLSGADPSGLSMPLNPAFSSDPGVQAMALTNIRTGAATTQSFLALFALEPDTPTTGYLSAKAQATPALFYAAGGDILDLVTGETLTFAAAPPAGAGTSAETLPQWYIAAKPVRIMAEQDIVNSGTRPATPAGTAAQQNQAAFGTDSYATASGDLFLNNNAQSVSVVSAGRDILSGYFAVGGPGLLEVDAGRNIQQIGFNQGTDGGSVLDYGAIKSLGSLLTGAPVSLTGGASLYVSAGLGAGADYSAFADLYLDPANQANLALPITAAANTGKVQQTYAAQLLAYLQAGYGYTGTQAGALAYFQDAANVPAASQDAFLRGIFFSELLASGQQYNDPTSRFRLSYERGRQAIDALLPGTNGATSVDGTPLGYAGALTMASGDVTSANGVDLGQFDAGIATQHGGDITVLNPGGQLVIGTSGGVNPGANTGIITNGSGNIALFSSGSVLLGKSRIFTNAGGNIQIWSSNGDINAGIGARTTVVFNPPIISYDDTGGLVETPAVPTSGAGIATEQPLPSIPPGNIDLTAPVGTIDAGEAGVRSSGNLNLAAARLANTSGFTAGGKTSGNSGAPSISLGSVEAASAAAGATQQAAQALNGSATQSQLPSIIEVEVLSVSGQSDEERRRKAKGI